MTDDDKALVERLRAWKSPWRGDGHENTIPLAAEAANYIEAQAAEIERLQERNAELHGQLMRMIDRWEQQRDALEAREALERIEVATRNEVRAGDKGYVSRYGINGIARAALEQSK